MSRAGKARSILTLDVVSIRVILGAACPDIEASVRIRSRTIYCAFCGDWGAVPNKHFCEIDGREIKAKSKVCTTLPCLPVLFSIWEKFISQLVLFCLFLWQLLLL